MDLNRYKIQKDSKQALPLPGLLNIGNKKTGRRFITLVITLATFEEIEEHLKKSYGDSIGSEFLYLQVIAF
jgi:hypothetical protein